MPASTNFGVWAVRVSFRIRIRGAWGMEFGVWVQGFKWGFSRFGVRECRASSSDFGGSGGVT